MSERRACKAYYRGFIIHIFHCGTGFRPHWCDSITNGWTCGHWSSTVDVADAQAKSKIDRQYTNESEEIIRKLKLVLKT
jgi:hypothetical protein